MTIYYYVKIIAESFCLELNVTMTEFIQSSQSRNVYFYFSWASKMNSIILHRKQIK